MWPHEVKEHMVRRLISPDCPTLIDLAIESGIPKGTLSRWRWEARQVPDPMEVCVSSDQPRSSRQWTAAERFRIVVAADGLGDEELGEFLRSEGLHEATLAQWRDAALQGLSKPARRGQSRRERALERELRRKEKALAEAAALLVLKKKARMLFGEAEDDESEDQ